MNRRVHVVVPLSMTAGRRRVGGVVKPRALMREALAKPATRFARCGRHNEY